MKKTLTLRILCLVLCVAMLLPLTPISVFAEIAADGTLGDVTNGTDTGEGTEEPGDEEDGIPDYSNPIPVTSADELEQALSEGSSAIRIDQDFALDRTFFVVADTVIIADEPRTLTRAADFGGDIFVVGENSDGTATAESVILTLGKPDETTASMLVIDGNAEHMTTGVVGTVIFVRGGSRADLYHNVTMRNHVKVGNAKTLNEEYSLSYPPRIGGAVAIVSSKADMRIYGGLYENNRVNDITDSSTDEGSLSSQGGVIYNYGRMDIYGGTFTGNHAGRGGVFYNYRTMNIYSADITDNTASALGGAIYVPNSTSAFLYIGEENGVTEAPVRFTGNTAEDNGGAIYAQHVASVKNAEFINNTTATGNGGAIAAGGMELSLEGVLFDGNHAPNGYGAAIYLSGNNGDEDIRELIASDTVFKNNASKRGGAVYLSGSARSYFSNVAFEGNTSTTYGGALYSTNATVDVNGATFVGNTTATNGGAIGLYTSSVAVINNVTASGNTGSLGGFAYVNGSSLDLFNSSISENSASTNGGAVYAHTDSVFNVYNTAFSKNTTPGSGGALMIYNGGTNAIVHTCTFDGNSGGSGGAIYISNKSQVQMYSITASNNEATKGGFMYETTSGTVVTLVGLNVKGNTATEGGAIIWGNTTNAKLYIDKIKYADHDFNGDWNDEYWASAIYNALKVYDQVGTVPSYVDYSGRVVEPAVPVSITNVSTAAQLERALQVGYTLIRLTADFALDRTFYVMSDVTIFSDEPRILTRAADFGGDIFVVGQNADGDSPNVEVTLTLGKKDGTDASLTIDGNRVNMTLDVVGTVIFVCDGARVDLCKNLTISNHKKVGNERTGNGYSLSYPPRVGGAVAIIEGGAELNVFGGLYTNNATNDMTDANTDEGSISSHGGAFYNHGTMNIYGGTITGNHAGRGGAIYNYRTLRIYAGTISQNTSSTLGGAIYTPNSTAAFLYVGEEADGVENGPILFEGNVAASGGGALYLRNLASIKNATFKGNSTTASYGGAIYAGSPRITLENVNFIENTAAASHGGAIYLSGNNEREETRELVARNCLFEGNIAASKGGAIYMSGSSRAYFENTDFTNHSAKNGGGVFYLNSASLEINGATISDNEVTDENGAVMSLNNASTALLNDVTATGNTASGSGGVAYVSGSTLDIYNSILSSNAANNAGAAYVAADGVINAYNTVFRQNTATVNAGALTIYNGGLACVLHTCTFDGNVGGSLGGGMYISNKSQVTMYRIVAQNNTADKGGFMYETTSGTVVYLVGLTVSGNTATTGGPIIWGNTTNAKLFLDKSKYTDMDATGALDDAYWASAIYNKLTSSGIEKDIPKYLDYGNEAYDHMADAVDVATADELESAILSGVKHIRIVADFAIDRTFYITGDTTIFTTIGHTLTRAPDFGGDMFVIGENAAGVSSLIMGHNAKLTLGNPLSTQENLLIIDGNQANMTVDVVGSVLFICQSSTVNLYANVTVQNCRKVGNERTLLEKYLWNIRGRIGGTLAIVESGTLNIYGGHYRNNTVNDELGSAEEQRISTVGGLIFNYSNLRIYGGSFENNHGARGGVIYNYRMVRIFGGSFIGNSASVSGGVYYAPNSAQVHLYVNNPDLTGSAVLFENNTATKSGGVIYASMLTANVIYGNASFIGNSVTSGSGGAICMYGQLTVRDSIFKNNTATNRGGAIYASHSSIDDAVRYMELTGCTFEANEAVLGGALSLYAGAADYPQGAIANITDCTFKNNKASVEIGNASSASGGAIYADRKVTITVKGSAFTGNHAATEAGAIYLGGESVATIVDSTLKGNTSGKYGGAIAVRSSYLDLINTELLENTAANNGGAIYVSYQSNRDINACVTIRDSLIKGNASATNGGAIYATRRDIADAWDILHVTDSVFESNTADKSGGALYTLSGVGVYIANVTFTQNRATASDSGQGGAWAVIGSRVELDGAEFTFNESADAGGALYAEASASMILHRVTANGNVSYGGGFAYLADGAVLTVYSSNISNNTATMNGGAIYVSSSGTVLAVYDTVFGGNTAAENGGALMIYNGGSEALLQDCTFQGNAAGNCGGGLYISNKSQVQIYDVTATDNAASKGGFLYETTSGTVVTLAGLTVSGNTATVGGPIIWGNTRNAKLSIDRTQYTDADVQGALDDAYWEGAIVNLLTVEDTVVTIPSYHGYAPRVPEVITPPKKPTVSVDHIFDLAQNSSDGYINATYDQFPVLDKSSNFMSDGTTYFENINGGTVSVDSFVYDTYAKDGNVNVGLGLLVYQAMLYKQAYPDEEVSIAVSSYRFSIESALNINRNGRYFGYMRNLYGKDYDEFGFVRISYLLVSAAKMGINVTVIGHIDGYPILATDPNLYEYFTGHMDTPCDPAYTEGVVGDYLRFERSDWTLEGKGGTDMMHNKMCAVSHYLDMNGVVHRNAVFSSSANLDGIASPGYNGNWKLQTATIISDHAEIYRVAVNYLNLIADYSDQEKIYEFQDIMATKGAEQIDLILAGQGDQIPADEQIVYLGSETDDVFELYFTPFAGDTLNWDEINNPYCKYIRYMYESEGSIIFTWNIAEYNASFSFGQQMEALISGAFHNNKNVENKFFGNMEFFDTSLMKDLVVGQDIGYLSINKYPYGQVHNKDILLSYVKGGQRYYVSLLNSCNMHSGSMCYQSNFMLVIKETDCEEDSVFFTMADLSTTGIVAHTYSEERVYLPEDGSHGYYYTECIHCGKRILANTIHRPGEWIVARDPAPGANGIQHKSCTVCGCIVETMEITVLENELQKETEHLSGKTFDLYTKVNTGVTQTPLTLEAVVQLSKGVSDRGGVIVGNFDGYRATSVINLEIYTHGRVRLYLMTGGIVRECIFDTDIRSESAVHLAVTVNGHVASLYVNGSLADTKEIIGTMPTITKALTVGNDSRSYANRYFKGRIYSVALFADVRTEAEIRKDMLALDATADGLLYERSFETVKKALSVENGGKTFTADTAVSLKPLATKPATIEAIVHVPKQYTGRAGVIFGNYDGSNRSQINLEIYDGGKPRLYVSNETTANSYLFSTDIRSDAPVHIAVTFVGKTAYLYVNGELASTVTMYYAVSNATDGFRVGGDNRVDNTQYFKGTLYALGLYGDARSAEQIRQDAILMDDGAQDLLYLCYYNAERSDQIVATSTGKLFTKNDAIALDALPSVPKTFEAVIQASPHDSDRQGVIVGNYDNSANAQINLEIYYGGVVRLFYNEGQVRGSCLFKGIDVRKSRPVHLAVTVDGRLVTLYVDGVAVGTDTLPIDLPNVTDGFCVGGDNREGNVQYLKCELFSLQMFSDVRTPEEIHADYLAMDSQAEDLIYSRSFEKKSGEDGTLPEYRPIGQRYDATVLDDIDVSTTPHTFEATVMLPKSVEGRGGIIAGNYVGDSSDQISFEIYEGGCVRLFYVNDAIRRNVYFTTDIRSDAPVHIAVTVDGTVATLYVNGVAVETVQMEGELPTDTKDYRVGGDRRYRNVQYFKGVIYSVSLFDDVRTAEEIAMDAVCMGGNTDGLLYSNLFVKSVCDAYASGFVHTAGNWIIDRAPTEQENGLKHKACTCCGEILVLREISNTRGEGAYVNYNTVGLTPKAESDAIRVGTLSSTPLTLEAVILLDPSFDDRAGVIIGSYDGTAADGLNLEIYTNGKPRLYYKVGGVGYSYVFDVDIRSKSLTHIALTIDGLVAYLYVNGELAGQATLTVEAPATLDFHVGNDRRSNGGQYFKGEIDSVVLFDDVRTAEEIQTDAIMVTETESGILYKAYFASHH